MTNIERFLEVNSFIHTLSNPIKHNVIYTPENPPSCNFKVFKRFHFAKIFIILTAVKTLLHLRILEQHSSIAACPFNSSSSTVSQLLRNTLVVYGKSKTNIAFLEQTLAKQPQRIRVAIPLSSSLTVFDKDNFFHPKHKRNFANSTNGSPKLVFLLLVLLFFYDQTVLKCNHR